ncbi:putative uncharacterized protein DDB_G0271606 [Drosophila takahashii]|uniref:putative uncharacterized protein DDB_G0271606 n=1 Tax=Drosophila takahashii TaxID=29030 RepID=UPI003898EA46
MEEDLRTWHLSRIFRDHSKCHHLLLFNRTVRLVHRMPRKWLPLHHRFATKLLHQWPDPSKSPPIPTSSRGGSGPRNPQQQIAAPPDPPQVAPGAPRNEGAPQQKVASPGEQRTRQEVAPQMSQQLASIEQRQKEASHQEKTLGGSGPRNAQQVLSAPIAPRRGETPQQQVEEQVYPMLSQLLDSIEQRQKEASHQEQTPGGSGPRIAQQVPAPQQRLAAPPVPPQVAPGASRYEGAPQQQVASPEEQRTRQQVYPLLSQLLDSIEQRQKEASHQEQQPGNSGHRNLPRQGVAPQQRANPIREEGSRQQERPSVIVALQGQAVGPSNSKRVPSTAPRQQITPPVVKASQRQPNHNVEEQPAGPSKAQPVATVAKSQVKASQQQGQPLSHQEKASVQLKKPINFRISWTPQQQTVLVALQGEESQQQEQLNPQAATSQQQEAPHQQQHLEPNAQRSQDEVKPTNRKREAAVLQQQPVVEEASPPKRSIRVGPKFWDEIQRKLWIRLWGHIARNVKRGRYDLKPLVKGQCPTCRRKMSCGLEAHRNMCQPEMYSLGCPCGYLCATMKSLNGHQASCDFHQEKLAFKGPRAFLPYISDEWRQCPLFASVVE